MDWLFDSSGFVPRRYCGVWTRNEIVLHVVSDFLIFVAYTSIPLMLLWFSRTQVRDRRFKLVCGLFAAFIFSCGFGHLLEVFMFVKPLYRLTGVWKLETGLVSLFTAFCLLRLIPEFLRMKSPSDMERQIRETTAELKIALQRKEDLLSILGHELRNPLAAIRNAYQLLHGEDDPEIRAMAMDILGGQTDHMAKVIDNVINSSRAMRGKVKLNVEHLLLTEIVERAIQIAEPVIDARRHRFSVKHFPSPVRLCGDKIRLAQAFANLLVNAAKYTPEGGEIRLACHVEDGDAVVTVSDNGIGIEDDALESIFGLCVRTQRAVRHDDGLGIGLAMVKTFIGLHDGTVVARSEGAERGSDFIVRLPLRSALSEDFAGRGPCRSFQDDHAPAQTTGA